jgi:hypothetical protein
MKKPAASAAAIAAFAFAGSLRAHHSISTIDISTPIWVKGTVVQYEVKNPHTLIELDETRQDGQVQRWTVEGPIIAGLTRYGLDAGFLKAGDVIEVCGFAPKSNVEKAWPPPRFVHGRLLVLRNGRMQLWGPYGKLDNCVRPDDPTQAWVDFLTNPMVREIWCGAYTAAIPLSALASRTRVDEINSRMANPCR